MLSRTTVLIASPNAPVGWVPLLGGVLALLFACVVCRMVVGTWHLADLWLGTDKKPSTSKFQFVWWNAVILFVYTTIAAAYLLNGHPFTVPEAGCTFPKNVWIVLGLSGVTAIAAKAITVADINSGQLIKPAGGAGGLGTSDTGDPDLTKIQMLTWTFVAIVIYLWQFFNAFPKLALTSAPTCQIPDIDITLMVLMGLSQGTYLGKKIVSVDTARITSITPPTGAVGTTVMLGGAAFGATQQGSLITIDAQSITVPATWSDTQLTFAIPGNINGAPLAPGRHSIGLLVNGTTSAGAMDFTLTPDLTTITPATQSIAAITNATITLTGSAFGTQPGQVVLDTATLPPADIALWSDQQIQIILRAQHPSSKAWTPGPISIRVLAGGVTSPTKTLTLTP